MQYSKKIKVPEHSDTHNKDLSYFDNVYDLNEDEAIKYIKGEVLRIDTPIKPKDGFVVLTYKNLALGWGKYKNNIIKNHYPKGLRIN